MFSRRFEFSTQVLLADTALQAITVGGTEAGALAADAKAAVVASTLASGPDMSDGAAPISAARGNLLTAQADETFGSLVARGITAMRTFKTSNGQRPVMVRPWALLVPPALEWPARRALADVDAITVEDFNPLAGLGLKVLVSPYLDDESVAYLVAEPSQQLGLEAGSVSGMPDPEIQTKELHERHGISVRVSTSFGCGWLDWRGVVALETTVAGG